MVFARRRSRIQQAIVETDDASSGFLQYVVTAFRGDQRGQLSTVNATRCSLVRRTLIRYMVGCTYRPLAICFNQHLPTWDEWSSPGELIHPGDWPSISSNTSSAAKSCLQMGYSQRHPRGWPRPGSLFAEAATQCESGSDQPPIGLPQRVRAPAPHPLLATRSVWEQMTRDAACRDVDC
jgi:hypothetical protein